MSNLWGDKKKVEAVTTWLALGKLPLVSAVTEVPVTTLRQWKLQPWWKELVSQIQEESTQELDTKLTGIIDKSLDEVNERVKNGEFILDSKTGTVKRIPVKLKDVHKVASDLLDKRDLVRGRPAQRQVEQVQVDILKKLAYQFAEWAQNNMRSVRVIDVEVVDAKSSEDGGINALHGERTQGLQEGIQSLPQPSSSDKA